jgi:hypothetical protein
MKPSLAQRLYDWSDRFREWDNRRGDFVWKRSPVGWVASKVHKWVYSHCDIIPF